MSNRPDSPLDHLPISGSTRLAGVIGDPVRHSLSPVLHNAAFHALGIDWVYVAMPVAAGQTAAALGGMRALGIAGLSVTMPHKSAVAGHVEECSDDARLLGAVNTVVALPDGRLRGDSTDGPGFVDALREGGAEPAGARVLVLGAGGAGRAVVLALARAGAREVVVVNRDVGRAAAAVALAPAIARRGSADEADACSIIVNATPQGMGSDVSVPVDPRRLGAGQSVNDLVYHPAVTPLLSVAASAGANVIGGLGMLLHQAGRQITLWTGHEAPIAAMRNAVECELAARAG